MRLVIQTDNLTKDYGAHRALSGVVLEVREGEVFGYLGPNGAGKSTTIRILMDFIRATEGNATVFGLDSRAHSQNIRRRTAYLPGDVSLYDRMTGRELLKYFANLSGGVDQSHVKQLSERLDCELDKPIRSLSRGNRQKIGLVQAFMHRSELIIMDEPSSGLDPLMQQEFYSLVEEVKAEGRTRLHLVPHHARGGASMRPRRDNQERRTSYGRRHRHAEGAGLPPDRVALLCASPTRFVR